ncbi:MAG: TfoX/Sxy family protein [Hyphomicrobiaceae bacterium]
MAVSASFREFVFEQLSVVGPVSLRSMFGGAGVFRDGLMFGLVVADTLYLKADEESRCRFEEEGMAPFSYGTKDGRNTIMSYWQCPERLYDDPDEMRIWLERAYAAAVRAQRAKPAPKPGGTRKAKAKRAGR